MGERDKLTGIYSCFLPLDFLLLIALITKYYFYYNAFMYKLQWIKDKFNKLHYKMLKILCNINKRIYTKRQKNLLKFLLTSEKGYNMITNWKQNGYSKNGKTGKVPQIRQKIVFLNGKIHNIWRKAPP